MSAKVFIFCLLIAGIAAKTCLEEVKELAISRPRLGAYKPICQPNGLYAETQYHEGYYFCVNPKTGEEILGTRVRFMKPKSCKLTPCLLQRHQGLLKSKSGMVGHFQPQCEADGSFKKIQCHGSTGYCFCVVPETGVKIEGTEIRGKPTNCETAGLNNAKKCLQQVQELESKRPLLGQFKPVCQPNGLFAETQCHEGYCYCVLPTTGEEILGTRVRFDKPKSCKATPCLLQRHHAMKDSARGMVGQFTPSCEKDGSFSKTQCHASTGYCFCVMPATGEKLLGTELRFKKPKSCELTECVHQRHLAMKSKLLGVFKPSCDENGAYSKMQCKEGICYCAFPETGEEIMGTRLERGQRPASCELTKCLKQRHDYLSKKLLGAKKAECTPEGLFKPVQCHEGVCYCVFPETGEEILGTMTRFGKPTSCKLTPCVMSRHKAWKMANWGLLGLSIPRCSANGDYQKVQCRKGLCWCVDPKSGKAIEGKGTYWTVPDCS